MQPIRENVLVKPFKSDEISEGGIYVPETARGISNKVRIVSVGRGSKDKPMKLKAGTTGYRVQNWGQEIEIDGELHFLMNQSAIIAIE